ncbi:PAS domain S-box protein [Paraburkholderia sp. B3]|uniref:PAS domain S-box protein n=1 Tax=Paraburkholderia sp. B3 TaxID=3134791 RepID=UPI003981E8FC
MMRNQKEDFRFLAENSADMVCRVGFDLVMHYASPSCERILGWKPEEMVGKGPDAFVFPEDLPTVAAAHERLMRDGVDPVPTEVRMQRKDGSYAWMEVNARRVQGDGGASGIVLVMRDISRRKLDEAESKGILPISGKKYAVPLASRSEHGLAQHDDDLPFRKAFLMTPIPMVIATFAGFTIIDVNDAFIAATGYAHDELRGRGASEVRLLDDRTCRHIATTLRQSRSLRKMEIRLRTREDAHMDCLLSIETATVDGQQCVLAVFQDVSERKRSEAELMEAIESVMKDMSWFSQAVIEKLAQLRQPRRVAGPEAELSDLTPRELEVLGLMCEGRTDEDISGALGLSRNTVRNHVSRIYTKIGVHRRAGAIVWARARGVLEYELPKRRARRGR